MKTNIVFFLIFWHATNMPMQLIQKIKNTECAKNIACELREAKLLLPMFLISNAAYAGGALLLNLKSNEFFGKEHSPIGNRAVINMFFGCVCAVHLGTMIASANLCGSRKRDRYNRLLIDSAHDGDLSGIKKYLSKGADVNCSIEDRNHKHTPLLWALHNNHFKIADYLKKQGANVNHTQEYNRTLLMLAVADQKTFSLQAIDWLLKNGALIEAKEDNGLTALSYACREVNTDTIQLLLSNGANPNTQDINLSTPLHAITWYYPVPSKKMEEKSLKAAILLRAHGAVIDYRDAYGKTPLFWAISRDLLDLTRYFLYEGADKDVRDINRNSPRPQSDEMAQLLSSKEKPHIPEAARSIMLEMASNRHNIALVLSDRERGKQLKRPSF